MDFQLHRPLHAAGYFLNPKYIKIKQFVSLNNFLSNVKFFGTFLYSIKYFNTSLFVDFNMMNHFQRIKK